MRETMSYNLQEIKIRDKHVALILTLIIISVVLIRIFFYPFDLPITHDGDNYFSYALDTSILNNLPKDYTLPNNGWPVFLSLFFKIFQFDSALEYMDLQRTLSITISVATIIPIYFLCRRFFSPLLSLMGCALFGFTPQIIQNSFLGITEPLYICLITTSIFLFLSKRSRIVYCSFWIIALASIVRYEGIILLIPFSIMFFLKFQHKRRHIPKYIFVIAIFILILLPIAYIRTETIDNDGFSNVIKGPQYVIKASSSDIDQNYHKNLFDFIKDGITGILKNIGWSLIPYFLILIPFGVMKLFRNIDHSKKTIILISIFLLIPAFYAYSREFQDSRYVFVMYPIFTLISLYLFEFFLNKIKKPKKFFVLVLTIIVCSSILIINYQLPDYDNERESLEIARYIYYNTNGVNDFYPETKYLNFVKYDAADNFPILGRDFDVVNVIYSKESNAAKSVLEYLEISKSKNLTHIVTNGENARPKILNEIFFNEEDYPYLKKIFDSKEQGYHYEMKIFEIDYQLLREKNSE